MSLKKKSKGEFIYYFFFFKRSPLKLHALSYTPIEIIRSLSCVRLEQLGKLWSRYEPRWCLVQNTEMRKGAERRQMPHEHTYQPLQQPDLPRGPESNLEKEKSHERWPQGRSSRGSTRGLTWLQIHKKDSASSKAVLTFNQGASRPGSEFIPVTCGWWLNPRCHRTWVSSLEGDG